MHRLQELVRLHRMGRKSREVARLLQMSPNTERRYRKALEAASLLQGEASSLPELSVLQAAVRAAHPEPEAPTHQRSGLDRWRPQVEAMLAKGMGPKAIRRRLLEDHGEAFEGSYAQLKRLCRALRKERGVRPEEVAIVVETPPGQVAQVDFGYIGKLLDPATQTLRKAYCFVMVLGYSRHMVARIVFDQKVRTWLRLHIECFEELGGVPAVLVPDNLKAAVVRAAFSLSQMPALNRSYRELARHYGFQIDPTPPYAPAKKGKVESGVRYLKRGPLAGRSGEEVTRVRQMLQRFLREEAAVRVHGTTGKRPGEEFEARERPCLRPLPSVPYEEVLFKEAKLHRDCHLQFDGRLYSAPWPLIGRRLWVRATPHTVTIYADEARVATHPRRGPGRRSTIEAHLPEHRRRLRHRTRAYWEKQAAALGEEVHRLIGEVFEADDVLHQLRAAQAIMGLLEQYPPHRARAAAARASFYGITSYQGVKRILVRALDLEPLPTAVEPAQGRLAQPRFARDVGGLFALAGVGHEPH